MDLSRFNRHDFLSSLKALYKDLHVPVNYLADEPTSARTILKDTWKDNAAFKLMKDVYFLGMVDDAAFSGNKSIDASKIQSDYDGVLIFGVTLSERENNRLPTRSQLAEIARAFNREYFYTPVIVVFQYTGYLAFANTERLKYKQEWREGEKAGKVSLLRDIDLTNPHAGHLRILNDLIIPKTGKNKVDSFATLYAYWQDVFSVNILNKKFYQELSNWYFWAIKEVAFPGSPVSLIHKLDEKQNAIKHEHNAKNVIRLLTRFLFVWFIKEKKLIPEELFDIDYLKNELLNNLSPVDDYGLFKQANIESVYYKAILQNLFFASLNCPIEPFEDGDNRKRGFRLKDNFGQHRDANYLMRYQDKFKNPQKFLKLIDGIVPFLNGGLFECLDNKTDKIYIDGFSDNLVKPHQLIVPDYLFFGFDQEVDLSGVVGISNKAFKNASVKGLISILESYKFTIAENTPIEEDVALDPELLGKVFENLLASYNPETKTTARKQTGSFYTPREIVNYMVDESLIAYLKKRVKNWDIQAEKLDKQLNDLLSYNATNPFTGNNDLQKQIIHALDNCKILDPACGSGAFPMGVLQKMVHILQKVDPENKYWQELQLNKAVKETEGAFALTDKKEREQKLIEINEAFDKKINDPDYARKLFLVEDCIYGVDIQPIATQISKLRFFISLVVDQKVDKAKPNFGIRSLPNLETKFVAANTLIGIEKPEVQMTLFNNREINELERELKKVRHRLFSAKSQATKRRLRDNDKEIREKIGNLLVKHGWGNKIAKQLAEWDPYDQNKSSPFFDPEWMFGIRDGFDVVIGNPPYIDSEAMVKIFPMLRESLKKCYNTTKGNWDIYIPFYEKAYLLIKKYGYSTYITPNKWLSAPYGKKLREYFQSELYQITDCSKINVFEAGNSPIIFSFIKNNAEIQIVINEFNEKWELLFRSNYEKKKLTVNNWGVLLSPHISIIGIINKNKNFLGNDYIVENPFSTAEAYQLIDIVNDSENHSDSFKMLTTGGIDPYESLWGKKKTSYLKSKYDFPIVKKNELKKLLPKRFSQQNCKKILLSGMRHFEAFFDKNSEYLASKSTIIIKDIDNYAGYFLTGILNSKLVKFYIKESYSALGIDGGINFSRDMVHNIPFIAEKKFLEKIADLSSINHALKESNISAILFESIIDALVFELYFSDHMKERNIDILKLVEKDLQEVMKGREFDKLTNDQKEKVINQLHTRWADPESEIVKRMSSFAEKSSDILKPMLESR